MLSKMQILNYLKKVADELEKRGLSGEVILAGGASMCLIHEARDATKDVDALYEPKDVINEIAVSIADSENLPHDWLNDSVKGFINANAPIETYLDIGSLHIQTVTTEYLLAMKLMSARYGEKDSEDILFLFKKLGILTSEQALKILVAFYPISHIMPKTQYIIDEIIEKLNK